MHQGVLRTMFAISAFLLSASVWAASLRVALVLDKGGRDDKSFNSAAYKGVSDAKQKLGIESKTIESSDDSFFEPALRSFASKHYDLIIGIGVSQAEAMQKVAKDFPQQKFVIIDAPINLPNVTALLFQEHEGSYLVGYIAGMKSKTGTVGFIGGMDIPLIRRFEKAYTQGVKAAWGELKTHSDAKVLVNYVGVTGDAWNNPTKAKELAQNQYQQGADIVFAPAGASNAGVFDAAATLGKFAIGVDSNQNWVKPGKILTSMLKRIDVAVYQTIESLKNGKWKAGLQVYGLKDGGIDWALDKYNEKLFTASEIARINKVKQDIAASRLHVIDYYTASK